MKARSLTLLLIKFLVSVILLWWVFSQVDYHNIKESLIHTSIFLLIIIPVIIVIVLCLTQTLRWWKILSIFGAPIKYTDTTKIVALSLFFNQIFPSTLGGDLIRVWQSKSLGISLGVATNSVICDRIIALLVLLVMCILGVSSFVELTNDAWVGVIISLLAIAGILCVCFLLYFNKMSIVRKYTHWRAVSLISQLVNNMWVIIKKPSHLFYVVFASIFVHSGSVLVLYYIGVILQVPVSLGDSLIFYPTIILLSMLPISIAGWGVRESAMLHGLHLIGVEAGEALSISLIFGITLALVGFLGGLLWSIWGIEYRKFKPLA